MIVRVVLLLRYPAEGVLRSFPRTGLQNDPLPDIGERVQVITCDHPGQTFTAVVETVDPGSHSYKARIEQ